MTRCMMMSDCFYYIFVQTYDMGLQCTLGDTPRICVQSVSSNVTLLHFFI